jgi:hypothetical protein
LDKAQAAAIVAGLAFKRETDEIADFERENSDLVLTNFWRHRANSAWLGRQVLSICQCVTSCCSMLTPQLFITLESP